MSKNTPFRYDYVGSFLRPETLKKARRDFEAVSYTHLRAHETEADLVCRLLLEKIFF